MCEISKTTISGDKPNTLEIKRGEKEVEAILNGETLRDVLSCEVNTGLNKPTTATIVLLISDYKEDLSTKGKGW